MYRAILNLMTGRPGVLIVETNIHTCTSAVKKMRALQINNRDVCFPEDFVLQTVYEVGKEN